MHFSFSAVNEKNADVNEIPFLAENENEGHLCLYYRT